MKYTQHQIDAAINAAETVASETLSDAHPVAVTNRTLLTLIAAAGIDRGDREKELQTAIDEAVNILKNA